MGSNTVVQTQNVAGLQDLQLLLACLGRVGGRGAQGTRHVGLPHRMVSVGKHTNIPL